LKYLAKCGICKADSTQFLDLFIGRDRFHEIKGEFHVQRCQSCGVVFLNPQPSFHEARKYYPDNYYSYHLSTSRTVFSNFLDRIKSLFYPRGFSLGKGVRILDLGCGNGEKVSRYLTSGADCYGVEINEKAVESARSKGVKAYCGLLSEQNFDEKFFDVIIMDNVLEHIMDPENLIAGSCSLLKKNGKLIISVPNHLSFTRLLFGKYWIGYDVPRHFYTYSPRSLRILAQTSGLIVERIRYVQNGYQFVASLRILLRSFSRFWKLPSERSLVFDNSILKSIVFFLLFPFNLFQYGDTIKVFFGKNDD
jgi:2-polyprenyl-3-methyl-5-hydroxy-6-metoxy-1,4-benzoquinol methylase